MSYELSIGPVSVAKDDEGNLRKGCRGLLACGYVQHPMGGIAVGDGNIQATLGVAFGVRRAKSRIIACFVSELQLFKVKR